jgi:hypothetical protein
MLRRGRGSSNLRRTSRVLIGCWLVLLWGRRS